MKRKSKIIISVVGITIVALALLGLTYAYFLTQITGNENDKSISVTTANLELTYNDGDGSIIGNGKILMPDNDNPVGTKVFTVTNNGNETVEDYAVILENFAVKYHSGSKAGEVTSFVNGEDGKPDMKLVITCKSYKNYTTSKVETGTCDGIDGFLPEKSDILVINDIEKDITHEYTATLTYLDDGTNQSDDMNKTIEGKFNIIDTKDTVDVTGTVETYTKGDKVIINSEYKESVIYSDGTYKLMGVKPDIHTIKVVGSNTTEIGKLSITKGETVKTDGTTTNNGATIPEVTIVDESRILTINLKTILEITEIIEYNYFDNILKSIAHRGYNLIAPENTIPSYELAKNQGFNYVEADVRFTSDGVPVLLHDPTINRTARMSDGSEIANPINIVDITYEQALSYDFGIWKGNEYADTKIPTFEEFLLFCQNNNLNPYIDVQMSGLTEIQAKTLVDLTKKYKLNDITWISTYSIYLNYFKKYDSSANLGFVSWETNELSYAIEELQKLKTDYNRVFLDVDYRYFDVDAAVSACKDASIELEVYATSPYLTKKEIQMLDPYISGVTHDYLIAGKVLYEGTNYKIVKVLLSNDIKYGKKTNLSSPYYVNDPTRASYLEFDIILEEGYTYKFEFDSSVETAQMGVQMALKSAESLINNNQNIEGIVDSGWQSSSYEYTVIPSPNRAKYVRFAFRINQNNDVITEDFIKKVIISRY